VFHDQVKHKRQDRRQILQQYDFLEMSQLPSKSLAAKGLALNSLSMSFWRVSEMAKTLPAVFVLSWWKPEHRERERERGGELERVRVHAEHLNYTIYIFCVTLVIIAPPLPGSRETLNPWLIFPVPPSIPPLFSLLKTEKLGCSQCPFLNGKILKYNNEITAFNSP